MDIGGDELVVRDRVIAGQHEVLILLAGHDSDPVVAAGKGLRALEANHALLTAAGGASQGEVAGTGHASLPRRQASRAALRLRSMTMRLRYFAVRRSRWIVLRRCI